MTAVALASLALGSGGLVPTLADADVKTDSASSSDQTSTGQAGAGSARSGTTRLLRRAGGTTATTAKGGGNRGSGSGKGGVQAKGSGTGGHRSGSAKGGAGGRDSSSDGNSSGPAAQAAGTSTPSAPSSSPDGGQSAPSSSTPTRGTSTTRRTKSSRPHRARKVTRRVPLSARRRARELLTAGPSSAGLRTTAGAFQRTRAAGDVAKRHGNEEGGSPVTRTVRHIVQVVPDSVKLLLVVLAGLCAMLTAGSLFSTLRARRLDRQRRELLQEVGLLQSALLPPVPDTVGALRTSVAYRPADGPGAGGDFYDALSLPGGRAGFILGDVSGHGRDAIERTAFMRYTLRAYLEAGLEPRLALQVAGRVVGEHLGGDFATTLLAVHDPATGSLTYASAGHPAPIVVGPERFEPVLASSSPPIGLGLPTGLRQTTLPLPPGSVACFHTDGLTEARTADGILGRVRLENLVRGLGREGTAADLLSSVALEARLIPDDMAACLVSPTAGVTAGGFRSEVLELSEDDLEGPLAYRFLVACGLEPDHVEQAEREAWETAARHGGALLRVVFGNCRTVEVLPRNVESLQAAARRAAAAIR
jgi:hypothetical protein